MTATYIRAWLQQSNNTLLPVLVIKDGRTANICVQAQCKPLTPQMEALLRYEEPEPQRLPPSPINRAKREWDNRERLIWDSADHNQLRQLHAMGHKPSTNKNAIRLQKALVRHEARVARDAARAAQRAEAERRRIIREARAALKAEREAADDQRGGAEVRTPAKAQSETAVESTPRKVRASVGSQSEPEPTPTPELKIEPVPSLLDFKIEALIRQIQQQYSVVTA